MDELVRKIVEKCFPFSAPVFSSIVKDLISKRDSHGTLASLSLQSLLRKQQDDPLLKACEKLLAINDFYDALEELKPFPELIMVFLGQEIQETSKIFIWLHLDSFEVTLDGISVVLVPEPVDKNHWALQFGRLGFSKGAERVGFRFEQVRGVRYRYYGDDLVKQFKFGRPETSWAEAIATSDRKIYFDGGKTGSQAGGRFYTHREYYGVPVYIQSFDHRYCGYLVE